MRNEPDGCNSMETFAVRTDALNPRSGRRSLLGVCLAASLCLAGPAAAGDADAVKAVEAAFLGAKAKVITALVNVRPVTEVYRNGVKTKKESLGSGVLFDPRGYIITNYHVAGKARRVICTLYNKERLEAQLVGGDALTDIAVIKIPGSAITEHKLVPAVLGDSDRLAMGQFVFAFGSPMALSRSMSSGIVSNPRRYLSGKARLPTGERTGTFNTWIQTDAAINPGNSGGPLVNLDGEVVGINARIVGFANNLGFAIPISIVKEVVHKLITVGRVDRSWLGVEFQPLQEIGAGREQKGVLISNVAPASPAATGGIRVGDIMVSYASQPVSARFDEEIPAIAKLVADTPVGHTVALGILRGDTLQTIEIKTSALGKQTGKDMECKAWGVTVRGITEQMVLRHRLEEARGVMVTGAKRGGHAELAGVAEGDVLREVAGKPTDGLPAFQEVYREIATAKPPAVLVKLRRRNAIKYAVIKAKYDAAK